LTKKFTLNLGLRLSLYGTYRERYRHAFSFDPAAFQSSGSPAIDQDGSATGQEALSSPSWQSFQRVVQCGGPGGTTFVPGLVTNSFAGATVAPIPKTAA